MTNYYDTLLCKMGHSGVHRPVDGGSVQSETPASEVVPKQAMIVASTNSSAPLTTQEQRRIIMAVACR